MLRNNLPPMIGRAIVRSSCKVSNKKGSVNTLPFLLDIYLVERSLNNVTISEAFCVDTLFRERSTSEKDLFYDILNPCFELTDSGILNICTIE